MDTRSLCSAVHDGTNDGRIISNDEISMIHRQITANDTVIAMGTWTRGK